MVVDSKHAYWFRRNKACILISSEPLANVEFLYIEFKAYCILRNFGEISPKFRSSYQWFKNQKVRQKGFQLQFLTLLILLGVLSSWFLYPRNIFTRNRFTVFLVEIIRYFTWFHAHCFRGVSNVVSATCIYFENNYRIRVKKLWMDLNDKSVWLQKFRKLRDFANYILFHKNFLLQGA